MKKFISKLSELPGEFSLSNYAATGRFEVQDWLVNLEFRALRRNSPTPSAEKILSAEYLLSNALLPESVCRAYLQNGMTKNIQTSQVRDQSILDAFGWSYYFDEDERLKKFVDLFKEGQSASNEKAFDALMKIPSWKALREGGIEVEGEAEIIVNLRASEEQLIEDFKSWLRSAKVDREIEVPLKPFSRRDMEDFSRFQVLPYLDLTFWALAHNCEISNQVLGLALFPDEYQVVLSDRIRKVVAPLAKRAVTYDFCDYLHSQVAASGVEYKSLKFVPDEFKSLVGPVAARRKIMPEQKP